MVYRDRRVSDERHRWHIQSVVFGMPELNQWDNGHLLRLLNGWQMHLWSKRVTIHPPGWAAFASARRSKSGGHITDAESRSEVTEFGAGAQCIEERKSRRRARLQTKTDIQQEPLRCLIDKAEVEGCRFFSPYIFLGDEVGTSSLRGRRGVGQRLLPKRAQRIIMDRIERNLISLQIWLVKPPRVLKLSQ
jgi:hypothetical protein